MATSFELPIQFVQHHVGEQGRGRTTLWRSLVNRADQTIFHHSGAEKTAHEFEQSFIGNAPGQMRHQAIVVNSVEKFLQVKIHNPTVTCWHILLRAGRRLMR
jgi:hypothetical protein